MPPENKKTGFFVLCVIIICLAIIGAISGWINHNYGQQCIEFKGDVFITDYINGEKKDEFHLINQTVGNYKEEVEKFWGEEKFEMIRLFMMNESYSVDFSYQEIFYNVKKLDVVFEKKYNFSNEIQFRTSRLIMKCSKYAIIREVN